MNDNERYFLYLRKSTDRDDVQVLSIDGQKHSCLSFAAVHGLHIVDTFVEHMSAKTPGRPVFAEMLKRINAGEANAILAYHPNRLARNSKDAGELIYWLDTGKIKNLKFPHFWFDNTPQGKSILGIEFAQSKRYSDDLSLVTKRGFAEKIRRGEYPGLAPRGYLNDRRTKTISPDPGLAPLIRTAYERFATGQETIETLRTYLAEHGLMSRPNHFGKGGQPIHYAQVRALLTNPIFYGDFMYDGVIHPGKHEPIITKALFDAVQRVISSRFPSKRSTGLKGAFNLIAKCGHCRMSITSEIQKGTRYYHCTRKSKFISCHTPYVREKDFEESLSALLGNYSLSPRLAQELEAKLNATEAHLTETAESSELAKRAELGDIDRKLKLLTDTYLDGHIDRKGFVQKQNELQSRRATLKAPIEQSEGGGYNRFELARNWIKLAQQAAKIAKTGSSAEKRQLAVHIFGSNLSLTGKSLAGLALKPWDSLLISNPSDASVHLWSGVRTAFGLPEAPSGE